MCTLISWRVITDRLICVYNGVLKTYNLCVNVHVDMLLVNVSYSFGTCLPSPLHLCICNSVPGHPCTIRSFVIIKGKLFCNFGMVVVATLMGLCFDPF